MVKVWLAVSALFVSVSCAGEKPAPRRSSAGQATAAAPESGQQVTSTATATQQAGGETKSADAAEEKSENTSTCSFKDSKFLKIFDLVYAATKLGVLKDDSNPEIKGVIEILKHIKDNMGGLGTDANLKTFAQETSQIASQHFTSLSDGEKLGIDAGVLAAMKAIDYKCMENNGDFTFTQLFDFASDILKAMPSTVNAKIGDYDLDSILTIAKTLGALLEAEE